MRKNSSLAVLASVAAISIAGCVVTPYDTQPVGADSQPVYMTEEQVAEPPPPLPVYEQPPCPEEGYIWTPGLWRWGPEGYFWVPGTWVPPPQVGMLWTPGYWAAAGAVYVFHPGYWGPHVGYYGGIDYGGGYTGYGYAGGRWVNNRMQYNTAISNVSGSNIHNIYREPVVNNIAVREPRGPRVSYVGASGTRAQPTRAETTFAREPRNVPTPLQMQHHETARASPLQNAARNEGRPPVAATPRPGAFTGTGVTAAKPVGPAYHPEHPESREQRQEH